MKRITTLLLSMSLAWNLATAQDTMYFYKAGKVALKQATAQVDSIIFYKVNTTQSNAITDADGNVYHAVTIGTQTWLVENLKTTKYNDGSSIPFMSGGWFELSGPGYCWYNYDTTYKSTYGALYNWYTVNTGNLAPAGWRVPTDSEWTVLTTYLGGDTIAAGSMKETGTTYWSAPNTGATNAAGFSALPGGYCSSGGDFRNIGATGGWWSSTPDVTSDAWCRLVSNSTTLVTRYRNNWSFGCSVRCIWHP
jgi:uncharacterized protein (TIGR02145 family)